MNINQIKMLFVVIGLLFGMAHLCKAELQLTSIKERPESFVAESVEQTDASEPLWQKVEEKDNVDYSELSAKVANSMKTFLPKNIKNIAIWRVSGNKWVGVNAGALRDSIEIAIVKGRQLSLIDRTKLKMIFQEQGLSQTGLVDPAKMKKIGKLYGLDAIAFVEILQNKIDKIENPTIIMKVIDTETGLLAYSAEFPVEDKYMRTEIDDLCGKFINSLNDEKQVVKESGIDTIAFWQIEADQSNIDTSVLISKLSNYFANSKVFKIIDRDNLKELLNEQAFGSTGLVDAATAKRLGKLYGVDAFVFGNIRDWKVGEQDGVLIANIKGSLKMIDVNTAQIVWADELQGNFEKAKPDIYAYFDREAPHEDGWIVPVLKSAVCPGWGQIDNGEKEKGTYIYIAETLTLGTSYFAGTLYESAWAKYLNASTRADMDKYYNDANIYYNIKNGCIYLAVGIWLWNMWDAKANYNPSKNSSNIYILPENDKILLGARLQL